MNAAVITQWFFSFGCILISIKPLTTENTKKKKRHRKFVKLQLQCSSPPSEIVLDPIGELSTRFHGHFSDFATKSFTAEADLQANTFA